jgi:farnesyl diphosphate synthase
LLLHDWLVSVAKCFPCCFPPQAFFLVADDIMDGSTTRRGQPCWYRQPHVGMVAINDGIILEACIFRILRKHFRWGPGRCRAAHAVQET